MNPSSLPLSAYGGLFAALSLALVCNTFLDIQYNNFAVESCLWISLFAGTLWVGWRQHGELSEGGKQAQRTVLVLGLLATVVLFMPIWGIPRAGLYMLATLQAANNCVTMTRRQLYFGLLVSLVMVMFAASHFRAEWTMLFYLIPYVVAVVFTLVAEQISQHGRRIRVASLGNPGKAGQGLAIIAATALILAVGSGFYLATPQVTWPYLASKYGQKSNLGHLHQGNAEGGGEGDDSGQGQGEEPSQSTGEFSPLSGWPSPAQMRQAAQRPGMPSWQSGAIYQMADLSEAIAQAMAPIQQAWEDFSQALKNWLEKNRLAASASLLALLGLLLAFAFWRLFKEARAGTWLRTRFDYWYLVNLARHQPGSAGVIEFYRATERLFLLHETPRATTANTREFLREATRYRDKLRPELSEMTTLFERGRYAEEQLSAADTSRMRSLYASLFRKIRQIG